MKLISQLGAWFARHRHSDAELDEEIRAHLDEHIEALVARGMTEDDARASARRAFGNLSVLTERSRDEWRWAWLEALKMDARHALRLIRGYPAFSINVILISAVGVAACAATFGLVNGVLLSPLPFGKPDEVYAMQLRSGEGNITNAVSVSTFLKVAEGSPVISSITASAPGGATVRWRNEPLRVRLQRITPSFFSVFGVLPLTGRQFTNEDADKDAPVLLLGHAFWQSRYGGDSAVVGSTMRLDSVSYTIIGVMPVGFRAHFAVEPDVWLPLRVTHAAGARGRNVVSAQLRLRPGIAATEAETWLATAVRERMESRTSRDSIDARPVILPIHELIYGSVTRPLQILMASVLLVFVLVVANVATLFLARSSARDHELSVRRALGASNARQLVQLVTESTLLVCIGGVLGVAISYWLVAGVHRLGDRILPRIDAVNFDSRVAAFAIVAMLVAGALSGLPAALAARRELGNPISGSRVTGRRMSAALIVAQISLSVVLLVGAGLLVKGFLRVLPSHPGFTAENRLMLMMDLPRVNTRDGNDNPAPLFVASVAERMRRLPGVERIAAMSYVPFFGSVYFDHIALAGQPTPPKPLSAYQNVVTPNLLEVLGISLIAGRAFTDRDNASAEPVAIVNQTAAGRWWPGEQPIGKRVTVSRGTEQVSVTVVGIMSDSRLMGSDTKIRAEIYLPLAQVKTSSVSFIVQTTRRQPALVDPLKRAVWEVAPDLPIGNSGELATYGYDSVREPRFFAWTMGAFALVAVLLSSAAVYGLLTLDVVQRRAEIGVRMAIGATGVRVGGLVLLRAVMLATSGVAIGVLSALALSRFLEILLIEVKATDASVFFLTVTTTLVLASVAACAPAIRALRVDPAQSLRGE